MQTQCAGWVKSSQPQELALIITHGLSLTKDPLAGVRGHAAIRGSHH